MAKSLKLLVFLFLALLFHLSIHSASAQEKLRIAWSGSSRR
jgi:hypothetical protein